MNPSYIKFSLIKTINSMQRDPEAYVKNAGRDFSRKRKISFSYLILSIISMEKHSLNRELRRFFPSDKLRIPTKSAFIQQRKKLNDNALPYIFSSLNSTFPFKKIFHGLHLLACDGSDVNIPPKLRFFEHLPELKVLVFDRPWNRECAFPNENYQRCADWESIRKIVAGE